MNGIVRGVMRRLLSAGLAMNLILTSAVFAETDALKKANELELQGQFKKSAAVLGEALQDKALSAVDKRKLEFELDRLERIKKDFPDKKDELFKQLRGVVKGLTRDEFDRWVADGWFDSREIDGERFFMGSSESNLFFRHPELSSRRLPPKDSAQFDKARYQTCVAIKQAALAEKKPYVLPKRYHVNMSVTAAKDAAPDGEVIRAWVPIPRTYPFQNGFELLSTSSTVKHIDDSQSSIRAIYLEQAAKKGKPTEFKLEYDYTMYGVSFDIKPDEAKAPDLSDPALKKFTEEAPHIVFTPEIRKLSQEIAGDEKNPYLKAKKFYDWIAGHIQYSYAIEYSTIRNISDYTRSKCYGDCGQEAFLFMTLCRLNGIPARWQTGWNTVPGGKTIHDWCEVNLAPYGWMPVDPYMGIYAMQYATTLPEQQRKVIRDFYFGGLDYYRMAANSDHNQTLTPPKESMRSDDVDFQRGELEWGNHNIYFDNYKWQFEWKEIKPVFQ
jgi:transglutaminase-like putative cysteine protease